LYLGTLLLLTQLAQWHLLLILYNLFCYLVFLFKSLYFLKDLGRTLLHHYFILYLWFLLNWFCIFKFNRWLILSLFLTLLIDCILQCKFLLKLLYLLLVFLDFFRLLLWLCRVILNRFSCNNQSFLWSFLFNDICLNLNWRVFLWTDIEDLRLRNVMMIWLFGFGYNCCLWTGLSLGRLNFDWSFLIRV